MQVTLLSSSMGWSHVTVRATQHPYVVAGFSPSLLCMGRGACAHRTRSGYVTHTLYPVPYVILSLSITPAAACQVSDICLTHETYVTARDHSP